MRPREESHVEDGRPCWRQIQWIDVVLVGLAVAIVIALTAELWLPHL